MACIQFLTGSRDQQFEELDPAATLTLGSSDQGVEIRVTDPGVEPQHCRIYPGNGQFWLQANSAATIVNMARTAKGSTVPLPDRAVFIVGQATYIKFWTQRPAATSGSGSGSGAVGGADPAALTKLQGELAASRTELEQLKAASGQAEELRRTLEAAQAEAEAAKKKASELEAQEQALRDEVSQAQARATELEQQAEAAKRDAEEQVAQAKREADERCQTIQSEAEAKQSAAQEKADAAVREAEEARDREIAAAKERAEQEQEELRSALEASRANLRALRMREDALSRDRLADAQSGSDLAAALAALDLPEAMRSRLEAAVEAEVDRKVLVRFEGAVVPLRGLRVPGVELDLEAHLRSLRQRAQQERTLAELGVDDLTPEELERLCEMAAR
ncbi:MAG: hypothetical protein KDD82_19705 [Planctomycetes bacterium]|nr:hypothetical protein [Planctomycetota bacterium]